MKSLSSNRDRDFRESDRLLSQTRSIILDELRSTSCSAGSSLIGHKVPLSWVASLLKIMGQERNLAIETFLIGIQISSTKGTITVPVRKSVNKLSKAFKELDSITQTFASLEDGYRMRLDG